MAGANKEQPTGIRRNRMSCCGDSPAVRRASGVASIDTEERVAIWDAVAAYIQEQLLMQKGVWIPTFGSFDTISKEVRTADGIVTLRWPVFHLASNLIAMYCLKPRRESLPAHRKVEPLKYSEVAAAASVSWQKAQACIQSIVSLLCSCLQNGEKVAVVLKDIGVILIDGLTFQMKFYHDFLEKLSGKEKFRKAVLKAPYLLDTAVSRVAPVASLVLSGCLVVFPKFQMEMVPRPPPLIHRKSLGSLPGEVNPNEEETLPPLAQGKKVRFASRPTYIRRLSTASIDGGHFRRIRSLLQRESSTSRLLPAIRAVPQASEQPVSCQLQGQGGTERQDDQAQGTKHVRFRAEEQGAEKAHGEGAVLTLQKTKTSCPWAIFRKSKASIKGSTSSSRAGSSQSKEPEDRPSRLPLLANDSVTLLRQRAEKMRSVRDKPEEPAASTSHGESSLPEESSTGRSGWLPPINESRRSPNRQPPKTKTPPSRKSTPDPQ